MYKYSLWSPLQVDLCNAVVSDGYERYMHAVKQLDLQVRASPPVLTMRSDLGAILMHLRVCTLCTHKIRSTHNGNKETYQPTGLTPAGPPVTHLPSGISWLRVRVNPYCTTIAQYTLPHRPRLSMLYTIQYY